MTVIQEKGLVFDFGRSWDVLKYDQNGGFYRSGIERALTGTKGIDFLICAQQVGPLILLEVKDFSLGVPDRAKFDQFPTVVAHKVRDTLAGIVGGYHRSSGPERTFFHTSYARLSQQPQVFYFFEDIPTPARRAREKAHNKRGVLLKQLKKQLRWLTSDIMVVGLDDYRTFIHDLTVRRV